ncbi:MAG TPA: patatin-like phospholipase family protein, partial [Allosphingosinicella sp.]|nr:patatin-like phospholipase family protein [Allosphingosinicella sp.]
MATKSLVSAALALALCGCVSLPQEPQHNLRFTARPTEGETKLLSGRDLRLGVALSGGGLRAALYSAGALRALYEHRILPDVDVLSTVSGGGYTGYWVYTGQMRQDPQNRLHDFGSARFADHVFPRSLCERIGDANFVPYPTMIGHALIWRTRQLYERRIGETFGREDNSVVFHDLAKAVQRGFPLLIVNATVMRPAPHGWRDGLYEMTPSGSSWGGRTLAGTVADTEVSWSDSYNVPYRLGVAASGAAIARLLYRDIPEPP